MFGRLKPAHHGERGGATRSHRERNGNPAQWPFPGGMVHDKGLVAAVLAHPPAWTNTLPVADPRGRAANARLSVPVPPITPLSTNAFEEGRVSSAGEPSASKGGSTWHSFVDPR